MGPAILLCPSSSAVHLWGQISPLKKTRQKEGSISLSHGSRCSANAHCTGVFKRRQAFFFYPASSSEKCRKPSYPFAWRRVAAAEGDVSVEEAAVAMGEAPAELSAPSEPSTSNEEAPVTTEVAPAASEEVPVATERKTQVRRTLNRSNSNANKAVVVSPAELLPGAVFPGKVTSIQTFGAFVDLGAYTNGLVHISRLSKSFVKKVEDVVQVGQDVKVQVLEVDSQANRISLMLVEEGKEESSQEGEAGVKQTQRSPQQQARNPRRESSKRAPSQRQAVTTTMKKGEIAAGTVKNIIKSGVFVTLPDGTDGYLPASEVVFKGPNSNMEAQFQVGQELTVRVLRIEKGRVNLTMKREMNFDKLNEDLNKGVIDGATNPFEIAFRRNELIASFLSDRDKQKAQAEAKEAKKEETVNSVEELEDAALKPAVEVVASRVDTLKDEAESSEAVNSIEEVKGAAEVEKPTVEEEEKVANGVDAMKDDAVSSEAVNSVEEVKDAAEVEKPAAEEEEGKVTNGVDTTKDDTVISEAVNSVEEVKDAAEVEKPIVQEVEKVANGVDATKDEAVLSEAVNSVEEVKDAAEVEKPVPPQTIVEEVEKVANGVDATKDEAVLSEAVNSVEEVKDAAEVEKPVVEEEEEKVAKGVDATKGEVVSSEADAENLITLV